MPRITVYQVPVLQRHRHDHLRRGGCLVEMAGTLVGGPWTDRPPSVEPVLAALARRVNDRTSDERRRGLLSIAPWLVGPPETIWDDAGAAVARVAGHSVLERLDSTASARVATYLDALKQRPGWRGNDRLCRRRAMRLVRLAVDSLPGDCDLLLRALLVDALNAARGLSGLPPTPLRADAEDRYPRTLPIQAGLRAPDGGDSLYLHCVAVLTDWPESLHEAWLQRKEELQGLT